jgi:hypothetical protein
MSEPLEYRHGQSKAVRELLVFTLGAGRIRH